MNGRLGAQQRRSKPTGIVDTRLTGRHRQGSPRDHRVLARWAKRTLAVVAAVALVFLVHVVWHPSQSVHQTPRKRSALVTAPESYIGLYRDGFPASYAGVKDFTSATGVKPNLVLYYSGWGEPFRARFATVVAEHGSVPLVQMDPTDISIAAIASGQYDGYLSAFAEAVRAYRHPVIVGFGHEMNGGWYSWGHRNTSPKTFVAAWRHMVKLFREEGAKNVTWLWTVNIMHTNRDIPSPAPWWPGNSYVNWVGIDGYYYSPSWKFVPLFGPTIAIVRELTHDPILISETAVAPMANQPAKIADLFAGIRLYGLVGFVWFDSNHNRDWQLTGPAAMAAFRKGAQSYHR